MQLNTAAEEEIIQIPMKEYIKREKEGIFGEDKSMPIIAVKTIKKITLGLVNKIKLFNSLNIYDILMKIFNTR